MSQKSLDSFPLSVPIDETSLSIGERLLLALAEDLDLKKSIKKLDITMDEARELLLGLIHAKRPLLRGSPSKAAVPKAVSARPRPSSKGRNAYELYVDGGSRGNPGPSGAGAVIKGPDGTVVKRMKKRLGMGTNNRAEYMALIMGVEAARKLGAESLRIYADSELMVRQISGRYKVKSPILQPLYKRAIGLLSSFDSYKISHIPRALNSEADGLANEAMDAAG